MRFLVRPTYAHSIAPILCGIPFGVGTGVLVEKALCLLKCKKDGGGNCSNFCNSRCDQNCPKECGNKCTARA